MAAMAAPSLGQVTSRELKRVLSEADWTVTKAGKQLGVTRRQVQRWLAGVPMPLKRLGTLVALSGVPITLTIGESEKAASPNYWARRLRQDTAAISDLLAEFSDSMAAEAGVAETMPPPSDDVAGGADPEDDPDVAGQPSKRGQS